jgi:hypothetical protein
MKKPILKDWAKAIALQVADGFEYGDGAREEDFPLLCAVLEKALIAVPREASKLIGTSIIPMDYFDIMEGE